MTLQFRIFHPQKRNGWNLTFSEKLGYYSFSIIVLFVVLNLIAEKILEIEFNDTILGFFTSIGFLGYLTAIFIRYGEYENLNGFFEGNIRFEEAFVEVDNKQYGYAEISDLLFNIGDYHGAPTGNRKLGPMYKRGVGNRISFHYRGELKEFYFELNAEYFVDKLYYYFINVISSEKVQYQRNYLNLIPEYYRDNSVFREFIIKLLIQKRIGCTEGLLMHGYKTDKEAKLLRQNYCC